MMQLRENHECEARGSARPSTKKGTRVSRFVDIRYIYGCAQCTLRPRVIFELYGNFPRIYREST